MKFLNQLGFGTKATLCLLAFAGLLVAGCGDSGGGGGGGNNGGGNYSTTLDTSLNLAVLDESQRQTLCQDLQSIGECTVSDNSATMTLSPPDDCDEFSSQLEQVDENQCEATVGDAIDCQQDCGNKQEECQRMLECAASGS